MPGLAAAQFKCVDAKGNITLTDLACPGRNIRGQNADKPAQPGNSAADVQKLNSTIAPAPAKQQPMDAANEKPARKAASPA